MRGKSWVLQITIMSVVLGMLLAVAIKTKVINGGTDVPIRPNEMLAALRETRRQNLELTEQAVSLKKKLKEYEEKVSKGAPGEDLLRKEILDSRFRAGLTAVKGPGVIVTLKDSPQKGASAAASPTELIIHDSDIRNFVNELVVAGAEAIAINNHRIVFRSAVRCVGPVVLINDEQAAAPYEIRAIGDPRTLEGALRVPQGLVDSFPDPQMVDIKQSEKIEVPAYDNPKPYKWAEPVEQ